MFFPSIDIKQALQEAQQHHRAGRLQQAGKIYNQILTRDPDNADAIHFLGLIDLQNGRCNTAARLIKKAIAINPDQAFYHINLGNALNAQGKIHEAISAFTKAIELKPDMAAAHNNLGVIYKDLGKLEDAAAAFNKAIDLKPDYASAHNNLGVLQKEQGKLNAARSSFDQALRYNPKFTDAHYNMGNLQQQQNQLDEACLSYKNALQYNPNLTDAYFNLGTVLHEQGKYDEAVSAYKSTLHLKPDFANAYLRLGNVEHILGNLDQAINAYKQGLRINPDDAETYTCLGNIYKELGNLSKAEKLYKKAIVIQPNFANAHCQLAHTKHHTEYDDEIENMERLFQDSRLENEQQMHLNFGLGKVYEDLRQYGKAFAYLLEGNRLKRNSYEYDIVKDRHLFDRIKKVFRRELISEFSDAGFHNETPVFILGMPRSGTTLLEQILSAHHDVYGAGELAHVRSMIQHFCGSGDMKKYPECIYKFSAAEFRKLGEVYVERLRLQSHDARLITNKMPLNVLHIGFIRLILPKARIIHSKRNPMDTCLSIFKNIFVGVHNYAYNLEELGQYYRLYEDLMAHWRSVLPDFIFEVEYEEMVSDQEKQTRRLLEFCGLEWDEACLLFHKSTRAVRTASSVQVRQPIYESSVQLWKRYEKELQPLVAALNYSA